MPPPEHWMRFRLLDQVTELVPGSHITAVKCLRPDEDYLKDHFPRFPVMPGVLMLEALFQASAWLVRHTDNYAHSVVLMKEARSIKYADFVAPNQQLVVTAEIVKHDAEHTTLKVQGTVDGKIAVSGRLVLERFNFADRYPQFQSVDAHVRRQFRAEFAKLNGVSPIRC